MPAARAPAGGPAPAAREYSRVPSMAFIGAGLAVVADKVGSALGSGLSSLLNNDPPPAATSADVVAQAVVNSVDITAQDCAVTTETGANVMINAGFSFGNKQTVSLQYNLQCSAFNQSDTDVQTNISNQLKQLAAKVTNAAGPGSIPPDVATVIDTVVCNNFFNCTFVNCAQTINTGGNFMVNYRGSISIDDVQTQSVNVMASCMMSNSVLNQAISTIANAITQASLAKKTGPIEGAVNGLFGAVDTFFKSGAGIVIGIVAILFILLVIIALVLRGRKPKQAPMMPMMPPPMPMPPPMMPPMPTMAPPPPMAPSAAAQQAALAAAAASL